MRRRTACAPEGGPAARARRVAWPLAALVAAACGDAPEPGPAVLRMAAEDPRWSVERSGVRGAAGPAPLALAGGLSASVTRDVAGALWIEMDLPRELWFPDLPPGTWACQPPVGGIGRRIGRGVTHRLTLRGRALRDFLSLPAARALPPPGTFHVTGNRVTVFQPEGSPAPEDVRLALRERHAQKDALGDRRVSGRRFSGEGFSLWPGETLVWRGPLPARAALSFSFCAEPAVAGTAGGTVGFRVLLDERELAGGTLDVVVGGATRAVRVELPPGRAREGTLRFEVEGPFAYTSVLAPLVLDLERLAAAERPPDVVVFLADTLRADALGPWGGDPRLAPEVERFAARARVFENAWSTATYTLPAHASMFTGRYPRELGVAGLARAIPPVPTIAGLLARRGYRCGAITDAGMVSKVYALDQGFQWFDERSEGLDSTLARARAFLDQDPELPVFLFVQTYRAHEPYHVSDATRAALGETLGLDFEETSEELLAAIGGTSTELGEDTPEARAALARLRALYLGGVADLDAAFGRFVDDLDARGLLERGVLVLASDHGEAFGERGTIAHRGPVLEAQTRVPLALAGRGIEPGRVREAASLLDLAPTIAELAGAPADPAWSGASLLHPLGARALYAFQCQEQAEGSTLAAIEWPYKVIAREDPAALSAGAVELAFDLAADPDERDDRAGDADWPRALLLRHAERLARLLVPAVDAPRAEPDALELDALRALGYAGEAPVAGSR